MLDYEIVTDKQIAYEYAKHCRSVFVQKNEKKDINKFNPSFLDGSHLDVLKRNNIEVLNV